MRQIVNEIKGQRLTCMIGAALLVCLSASLGQAQQPLLSAATHAPVPRAMTVSLSEGMALAPEPPTGQNNTAPLKDDLFAGTEKFAKNATEANEVDMDPDSLNLVNGPNAGRAHRTLLNVVRHYEYDKPGMYNPADVEEFRRKLEGPDWHCSIHSRDLKTGESTDICSRHRPPDMIEQAIITVEPKELTFIHQIRKANGQGGSLDVDTPGMSSLYGLPLDSSMAAMGPIMQAEMMASSAVLQAEAPLFAANFGASPMGGPPMSSDFFKSLQAPKNFSKSLKDFKFTPEQKRQFRALDRQMQQRFIPASPVPPAPEAPLAPTVPSAPAVPAAPNPHGAH